MGGHATKEMAQYVIHTLREAGHEALLAGGCVRDMLLGLRPTDYDVATSATPDQVKPLFRRVLMVGAKFGVAMVILHRRRIEVTTFRTDVSYSDGRRPDAVKFVSARQDAIRRDFTINGMFLDLLENKVVDYVGGQADLKAGVIRAIGQPEQRFAEDYLRMLRAVRFAARFDFALQPETAGAIREHAGRITQISGERIREELEKMFVRPSAAKAMELMHELGLLRAFLPELYAKEGLYERALRRMQAVGPRCDVLLSLAALLCELRAGPQPQKASLVGHTQIRAIIRRWGGSNAMKDSLEWMAQHLDDWRAGQEMSLAALKRLAAKRDGQRLVRLWRAQEQQECGSMRFCRVLARRLGRLKASQIAPPPLVSGKHLKRLGLSEGPLLGKILSAVYEAQLNELIRTRPAAMELARELMRKEKG